VLTATPARSATVAMFGLRFILGTSARFYQETPQAPGLDPNQPSCWLIFQADAGPVDHIAYSSMPNLVIHKPEHVRTVTPITTRHQS
jgi:hypothetical protein